MPCIGLIQSSGGKIRNLGVCNLNNGTEYNSKVTIFVVFCKHRFFFIYRDNVDDMHIRCKFGSLGQSRAQFHSPHGFCMGLNEEIIVADTYNHRIQVTSKFFILIYYNVSEKD